MKFIMDEAERRFQACVEQFGRDLGDLVMRCVDEEITRALEERELKLGKASRSTEQADEEAASSNGAGSHIEPADGESGEVVMLRLDALKPQRERSVPRVRPDSILGEELAVASAMAPPTPVEPAEPVVPKTPLFVHRRARDGRIHELSRNKSASSSEAPPPGG